MTLVFLQRFSKRANFSLILIGAPCKGMSTRRTSFGSGNFKDNLMTSPHASGAQLCPLLDAPAVSTIQFLAKTSRALFSPAHDGGHTTNVVGVMSQDLQPLLV